MNMIHEEEEGENKKYLFMLSETINFNTNFEFINIL